MIQLPKKRPWILISLFYLVIIGGWIVFFVLAKNHSGNKRSPEEAEALLKVRQVQQEQAPTNPPQSNDD